MKLNSIALGVAVSLAMIAAGPAVADLQASIKQYTNNMDTSNLSKHDEHHIYSILHGSRSESEKRNHIRGVVRKSNERAAGQRPSWRF